MVPHTTKLSRAESARINGAKSKGPKTPEGKYRSHTASYKNGLYAVRNFKLPGESNEEYAEFQNQLRQYWQPKGFYDEALVEEMVGVMWESKRLHAAKNDYVHDQVAIIAQNAPELKDQAKTNLLAEIEVSIAGGKIERLNARLAHLSRERHRLQHELLTLKRNAGISGGTQMSLIINNRQHPDIPTTQDAKPVDGRLAECPYVTDLSAEAGGEGGSGDDPLPETLVPPQEPAQGILNFAQETLDFQPDDFQAKLLTETNTRILVLGPRQTGKSTAAAARVLYEAMSHDDAVILLASASGRQSGQIMEKARRMAKKIDVDLFPPPPKCDGFTLANGAQVVALPDSQETIRGFSAPRLIVVDEAAFASPEVFKALEPMLTVSAGTIMLLSTPNGQNGYFYEQWHNESGPWTKYKGSLEDCPRVSKEAIEQMRQTMSKDDFAQEFECKFIASGGQFISREVYRACLRDDFELFMPDFDKEEL